MAQTPANMMQCSIRNLDIWPIYIPTSSAEYALLSENLQRTYLFFLSKILIATLLGRYLFKETSGTSLASAGGSLGAITLSNFFARFNLNFLILSWNCDRPDLWPTSKHFK